MKGNPAILVFSHLRWDFVYQRPQHLISRLAETHHIFYVEEPDVNRSDGPEWEFQGPAANITICRPHTPSERKGFHEEQLPYLQKLLQELLKIHAIKDYILWFYTPLALPATDGLSPLATVYDCMDELSAFLGAPPELIQRESELLKRADLVFTGGPSLYRSKKGRHPDVYCFPSSVDAAHFARAEKIAEAPDEIGLPHPRLGYYGVIDERLDLALLAAMAEAHPEWQIVMVGPVVKIEEAALPRNPNIRYYGQRSYEQLPSYLAGWDVCLMPFARNPSTEFISPTKTLEYMAAGKMIVSTPITDVAEPYGDIVRLGSTPGEFIAACEKALCSAASHSMSSEYSTLRSRMHEILSRTSWDSTAAQMLMLLDSVIERRRNSRRARTDSVKRADAVVIGAGPTGLSAAYHLGAGSVLLEQNSTVGGWCRSIEVDGFTFDYAGHIMFSSDPYVHQLYKMLLGDNVHWQDREAWIYSKNVYTRYPFQASLYGLPPNVIAECIAGAVEARFGPLTALKGTHNGTNGHANGQATNGHLNGHSDGHAPSGSLCKTNGSTATSNVKDCCGDGILESSVPLVEANRASGPPREARNFEEFIYNVWGAGIARHFAIPYNKKLWAVPLNEMETSWLGGRVPLPDLREMIEGALSPAPKPMGPNARFGYPLRGGFQSLMNAWVPHLKAELRTNTRVASVAPARHTVTLHDGSQLRYDHLISTMPLPVLIRQMGADVPDAIRAAAESLRYVSVRCVHIGIDRERLTEKHWIYYPEDTVFHRIFVQGNASPFCNPPGGFGLTCEITWSSHKPLPCDGNALIARCVEDCRRVGIIGPDDEIRTAIQCDLPYAYVVYDHNRAAAVQEIRTWLAQYDVILAGRYSEWEYYNSDHAFLAGKRAADQVHSAQQERSIYTYDLPELDNVTSSAPSAAPVT